MLNTKVLVINGGEKFYNELKLKLINSKMMHHHLLTEDSILSSMKAYKPNVIIACSNHSHNILKTIKEIRTDSPEIPVIMVTLESSEALAIEALKAGVSDYFKAPIPWNDLRSSIEKKTELNLHEASFSESVFPNTLFPKDLVAYASESMKAILSYLFKVAAIDTTVLITGETGTGKGLMAELIHRYSPRNRNKFMSVNCAALPENLIENELFGHKKGAFTGADTSHTGKFVLADKGSLFLDEIGEMNMIAQAKILKSIENNEICPIGAEKSVPIDVRIIAATNQEPEKLINEKKFRQDLFYRLNVARIYIPPLRERREDISPLIDFAIQRSNRKFNREISGLSRNALDHLTHYQWPGNTRELFNIIEAAAINTTGEIITLSDLPDYFIKSRHPKNFDIIYDRNREKEHIISVLIKTKGNKKKAAEILKFSRMTLYRKIRKFKIHETSHSVHQTALSA